MELLREQPSSSVTEREPWLKAPAPLCRVRPLTGSRVREREAAGTTQVSVSHLVFVCKGSMGSRAWGHVAPEASWGWPGAEASGLLGCSGAQHTPPSHVSSRLLQGWSARAVSHHPGCCRGGTTSLMGTEHITRGEAEGGHEVKRHRASEWLEPEGLVLTSTHSTTSSGSCPVT
jgi:hypothetical protein